MRRIPQVDRPQCTHQLGGLHSTQEPVELKFDPQNDVKRSGMTHRTSELCYHAQTPFKVRLGISVVRVPSDMLLATMPHSSGSLCTSTPKGGASGGEPHGRQDTWGVQPGTSPLGRRRAPPPRLHNLPLFVNDDKEVSPPVHNTEGLSNPLPTAGAKSGLPSATDAAPGQGAASSEILSSRFTTSSAKSRVFRGSRRRAFSRGPSGGSQRGVPAGKAVLQPLIARPLGMRSQRGRWRPRHRRKTRKQAPACHIS